jgi:hypothetical protein
LAEATATPDRYSTFFPAFFFHLNHRTVTSTSPIKPRITHTDMQGMVAWQGKDDAMQERSGVLQMTEAPPRPKMEWRVKSHERYGWVYLTLELLIDGVPTIITNCTPTDAQALGVQLINAAAEATRAATSPAPQPTSLVPDGHGGWRPKNHPNDGGVMPFATSPAPEPSS